jgi:hypothetical protein
MIMHRQTGRTLFQFETVTAEPKTKSLYVGQLLVDLW